MIESARLEGASEWQIFRQLVLLLSIPLLAACALFQFLGTWNDFVGSLIYLNDPNRYTLACGLQHQLHGGMPQSAEVHAGAEEGRQEGLLRGL